MARFTLKAGSSREDIGKIILDAVYGRFKSAKSPTGSDVAAALKSHLVETASGGPEVKVHFDSDEVLNIIIPFLDEEDVMWPLPDPDDPGYHLWKIAYEAMGTVVIRGCGK